MLLQNNVESRIMFVRGLVQYEVSIFLVSLMQKNAYPAFNLGSPHSHMWVQRPIT